MNSYIFKKEAMAGHHFSAQKSPHSQNVSMVSQVKEIYFAFYT